MTQPISTPKVVLSMCVSLNGFIAREDGQEDWLPSSGWDEFLIDAKAFGNIVMGRETYELVTELYSDFNFDNVDTKHKVVVSRNAEFVAPDPYSVVSSPKEALTFLREHGIENVLLIGGGKLNAEFLRLDMVDEIWLTIVPHILGKGRPVIGNSELDLPLTLMQCDQLSGGRFRAKYRMNRKINESSP